MPKEMGSFIAIIIVIAVSAFFLGFKIHKLSDLCQNKKERDLAKHKKILCDIAIPLIQQKKYFYKKDEKNEREGYQFFCKGENNCRIRISLEKVFPEEGTGKIEGFVLSIWDPNGKLLSEYITSCEESPYPILTSDTVFMSEFSPAGKLKRGKDFLKIFAYAVGELRICEEREE